MADTLYLDRSSWDLSIDASGNIAVATAPYALCQDAAAEARTYLGECYYDTARGVPYLTEILGKSTPIEYTKAQLVAAARRVPEVVSAKAYLTTSSTRKVGGQIQITDTAGTVSAASF